MNTAIAQATPSRFSSGGALDRLKREVCSNWSHILLEYTIEELVAMNNHFVGEILKQKTPTLDRMGGQLEGAIIKALKNTNHCNIIALETIKIPYSDNDGGWRTIGYLGIGL